MKLRTTALYLFWSSVGLVIYSYVLFPILIVMRGKLRPRPIEAGQPSQLPSVSLIIAAYNEAAVIAQKLNNSLAIDYPQGQFEIIVASDGSTDGTNELVQQYQSAQVKLLELPRQGKNKTLNDAVVVATGDILVFTDADSMFAPDALRYLVAPFADPAVGGVAGDYRHDTSVSQGANERDYWSYERYIKEMQSHAHSLTAAWGPIYAIRRPLYNSIPAGVTDDYYISAQVLAAHQRLVYQPKAKATGPVANSTSAEFSRKVRIISAGLQGVWIMRRLFNPFEYGFIALQVFSHKFLRRLMVIPLITLAFTAPLLWTKHWFYKLATIGQLALHSLAGLGFLLRHTPRGQTRLLRLPFFFDMVYAAAAVALVELFKGSRHDIWATQNHQITELNQ